MWLFGLSQAVIPSMPYLLIESSLIVPLSPLWQSARDRDRHRLKWKLEPNWPQQWWMWLETLLVSYFLQSSVYKVSNFIGFQTAYRKFFKIRRILSFVSTTITIIYLAVCIPLYLYLPNASDQELAAILYGPLIAVCVINLICYGVVVVSQTCICVVRFLFWNVIFWLRL